MLNSSPKKKTMLMMISKNAATEPSRAASFKALSSDGVDNHFFRCFQNADMLAIPVRAIVKRSSDATNISDCATPVSHRPTPVRTSKNSHTRSDTMVRMLSFGNGMFLSFEVLATYGYAYIITHLPSKVNTTGQYHPQQYFTC